MKEMKHMQKVLNTGMFTQRQYEPVCAPNNTGAQRFASQQQLQTDLHQQNAFFHFHHQQIQSW